MRHAILTLEMLWDCLLVIEANVKRLMWMRRLCNCMVIEACQAEIELPQTRFTHLHNAHQFAIE